jgi:hypothetical protein
MEIPLTGWRAERVDALLRGARQAATPEDERILAAVTALSAVPPPSMRPEFRAQLRATLLAEPCGAVPAGVSSEAGTGAATTPIKAGRAAKRASRHADTGATRPVRHRARRYARPVLVGALASSVAAVGAVGVAAASRGALPGEPLYGVKRHVEQMRLTFAGGEVGEAEAHLKLARTRMSEIRELVADADAGDEELPGLLRAWREEVDLGSGVLVQAAMDGDGDARSAITEFTTDQSRELTELLRALPDDAELQDDAASALAVIEVVDAQLSVADALPGGQGADSPGPAPGGGAVMPEFPASTEAPGNLTPSPLPGGSSPAPGSPSSSGSTAPGPVPSPDGGAPTLPIFPTIPTIPVSPPTDGTSPSTIPPSLIPSLAGSPTPSV